MQLLSEPYICNFEITKYKCKNCGFILFNAYNAAFYCASPPLSSGRTYCDFEQIEMEGWEIKALDNKWYPPYQE